jgi:hypothetical protein
MSINRQEHELQREIQNMRMQSCRRLRGHNEPISGAAESIYFLFRCFLAAAFFIASIAFPMTSDSQIPKELTEIPEYISVNYTIEDVSTIIDSLSNQKEN